MSCHSMSSEYMLKTRAVYEALFKSMSSRTQSPTPSIRRQGLGVTERQVQTPVMAIALSATLGKLHQQGEPQDPHV